MEPYCTCGEPMDTDCNGNQRCPSCDGPCLCCCDGPGFELTKPKKKRKPSAMATQKQGSK